MSVDFEKHPILVIDDDRKLCGLVKEYLEPLGYQVSLVHTGPEGLEAARDGDYEAILLDVMLPGMDGFEVLRHLREYCETPVLMLTARGDEADRIVGLEIGADDYLPKTFSTRELLARLRAVTRRSRMTTSTAPVSRDSELPDEDLAVGPLTLNLATRSVFLDAQPLILTPVEFELLSSLLRAKGRVKSREQLVDEIADREFDVFDRSVDVHISALRRKLGDDPKAPRFIRTVRAVGYMLIDPNRS